MIASALMFLRIWKRLCGEYDFGTATADRADDADAWQRRFPQIFIYFICENQRCASICGICVLVNPT